MQAMIINCLKCACGSKIYLPQRFIMAIIMFLGFIITYCHRVSLNFALTVMLVQKSTSKDCPSSPQNDTSPITGGGVEWNNDEMNLVLGSFYIGYFIAHVPVGLWSDKYGARHVMSLGVLISTLATLMTPVSVVYLPWWVTFMLRIVMGLGQAVTYPCASSLYARWIPHTERGLIGGFSFASNSIGAVTGNLCTGLIIYTSRNWPIAFYLWGVLGMVWYVTFLLYVYSSPLEHPHITDREKTYLVEVISHETRNLKVPWKAFFKDWAIWGLVIGEIGHDLTVFTLITNIPTYMHKVLHYNLKSNMVASAMPYICQWFSATFVGRLVDYIITRKIASVYMTRVVATTIGLSISSFFIVLVGYMRCNSVLVIVMFCLVLLVKGPFYCGLKINHLDMSINFAGILMAMTNGAGALSGMASSFLIKQITKDHTINEWLTVFWVIFIFTVCTNVFYVIVATDERREWDVPPEEMEEFLAQRQQRERERRESRGGRVA